MHRWHTALTADTPNLTPDPEPVKSALRSTVIAWNGSRWYSFDPAENVLFPMPDALRTDPDTGHMLSRPVKAPRDYGSALRLARRRLRDRARRKAALARTMRALRA